MSCKYRVIGTIHTDLLPLNEGSKMLRMVMNGKKESEKENQAKKAISQ